MLKYCLSVCLFFVMSNVSAATYQVLGGTVDIDGSGLPFDIPGAGTFTENVFDGSASSCCTGTDVSATSSGLGVISLWSFDLHTYFAETGVDGGIHTAPTIDLATMTADMGSFYAFWNGQELYQGGTGVVVDLGSGIYEITWQAVIPNEPKLLTPSEWTMQVKAVPVPAAVWLFGSGLIGLAGFARRNR